MLNRSLLIVHVRQPFLDWLQGLPDPVSDPVTLDTANEDASAYLVPGYDDDEERDSLLRQGYEVIFEDQLAGWWTDEAQWPRDRSFETFQAWFDVSWHSTIEDLVDGPLEDE